MADQIGQSGKAFTRGIPAATLTWVGHASGAASRSVTIHNNFDKVADADVSESTGNDGEFLSSRRRNKRWHITVTSKPAGANSAAALAIADDPPMKMDLVTISGAGDTRLNHAYWIIEDAPSVSYTPEGEATISLKLKCYWTDDTGAATTIAALS